MNSLNIQSLRHSGCSSVTAVNVHKVVAKLRKMGFGSVTSVHSLVWNNFVHHSCCVVMMKEKALSLVVIWESGQMLRDIRMSTPQSLGPSLKGKNTPPARFFSPVQHYWHAVLLSGFADECSQLLQSYKVKIWHLSKIDTVPSRII